MKDIFEQSYYELLDISPNSNQEQIQKGYLLACQTYQTNSLAVYTLYDDNERKKILAQIEKAYFCLINSESRKKYDAELQQDMFPSPPQAGEKEQSEPQPSRVKDRFVPTNPVSVPNALPETNQENSNQARKEFLAQIVEQTELFNGDIIRQVREILGYSLEDVALVTKIRLTYLQSIEEEQYEKLPARLYIRGFVENYCNFLGLPGKKVMSDYMKKIPL